MGYKSLAQIPTRRNRPVSFDVRRHNQSRSTIVNIKFYRTVLNSNNEPYDSILASYTFEDPITGQSALEKAIKEFTSLVNKQHWSEAADRYEII